MIWLEVLGIIIRYLNIAKRVDKMFNINESLKYIEIETNNICTRRCKWCKYGSSIPEEVIELDTSYIIKIVEDLIRMKFKGTIALYGINEPLLDERIISGSLIKLLKDLIGTEPMSLTLTTNGDLLSEEVCNKLFQSGLDSLYVSCYDDLSISRINGLLSLVENIIIFDQRRYENNEWESNRAGTLSSVGEDNIFKDSPCYLPYFRVVVGHDGKIRLCNNEMYGTTDLGNIKESSIVTLLNECKFSKLREGISQCRSNNKSCANCNVDGSINYIIRHLSRKSEVLDVLRLTRISN